MIEPSAAVERLPVEMWYRILSLAIHIPHLDSIYDDAFLQSRRNCSVQAVQHAISISRIIARVLTRVCSSWKAFIDQNKHQVIVLASPHDIARFLALIRRGGHATAAAAAAAAATIRKEKEWEILRETETENCNAGQPLHPPRVLLTATRRIDVLFSLGEHEAEVQTYLSGVEEIIRACPNLSTLRVQEPAYPRLFRSQETTNILHKWPSTLAEPDGGDGDGDRDVGVGAGAGMIGTTANRRRLDAFHFHPQFDNEHFERALDWSTIPGLTHTFTNLRLLSCTIAFSSRWDEFRPPFTTKSVGVSLPNLRILHIAWMVVDDDDMVGVLPPVHGVEPAAAVHLPQYFRQWDLPRLRHLRVHRVKSSSWGIILALLNKNSPQLESLSINVNHIFYYYYYYYYSYSLSFLSVLLFFSPPPSLN
jgi:hypothetical protein